MDTDSLQKNDFMSLAEIELPFIEILNHLPLIDKINLASTNKEIKRLTIKNSQSLHNITKIKTFNLDLFPDFIGENEINTIYRVFSDIRKLKVNLTFAHNGLLDNLNKFKNLQKLSV